MQIPSPAYAERGMDEFGLDREYIARRARRLLPFLCDHYWRVEVEGLEYIPRQGAAVLAGTHRGFMPCDAVMALYLILRATGRIPRFLSHPGLFKFPPVANFVAKMGGVLASRENADRILHTGQLLGVYPEGVRAAFSRYQDAYTVQSFGRHDFVKMALRHRVPVVPFVNVGSAEALPVFAQVKSRRWTGYAGWPCIPVSTFPFIPVPLPSKWHIRFLPPVECTGRPESHSAIREVGGGIREQMQQAINEMLRRRRWAFWGSAFGKQERA
jgi:1-acyl-sn-glycerol-3-phosphate acyltransferase